MQGVRVVRFHRGAVCTHPGTTPSPALKEWPRVGDELPCSTLPFLGLLANLRDCEATCFIFNLRLCQDLSVSQRGGSAPRSLRLRGRRQTLGAALKPQVHAALWGCKRGPQGPAGAGLRPSALLGEAGRALPSGRRRRAAVGLWLGKPCSSASTQRPGVAVGQDCRSLSG